MYIEIMLYVLAFVVGGLFGQWSIFRLMRTKAEAESRTPIKLGNQFYYLIDENLCNYPQFREILTFGPLRDF